MAKLKYSKIVKNALKKMDHFGARKDGYVVMHSRSAKDEGRAETINVRFTTSGLTLDNSWTLDQINKMAKTSKL